jgi:hypothetical protein
MVLRRPPAHAPAILTAVHKYACPDLLIEILVLIECNHKALVLFLK